jgi:TPR repeat protein
VAQDYERAAQLNERAFYRGSPAACYNLAVLHQNGTGVERNPGYAGSLMSRACSGGYAAACPQGEAKNEGG